MQSIEPRAEDDVRSDMAILERIVNRDERAVAELYDKHSRLLFSLLVRMLGSRTEAEDVLQDVFLSVWTKAESYNQKLGSPVGWLISIARNRGIDRLRASAARTRTVESVCDDRVSDSPELSAVDGEKKETVHRALAALPTDQRELIEHAYFLGLTQSELAARFSLPLGTVKTRVRSGLTTLRAQLARRGID